MFFSSLLERIRLTSPLRHMVTPGGHTMSVGMTNVGDAGWVTDAYGYRYSPFDPLTGRAWPALPPLWTAFAERAAARAGFPSFRPDACLVNAYGAGARMTLHQDRNERDFDAPIVSVSLGLAAVFLWGGDERSAPVRRFVLEHGDVVVWGGAARLRHHGVEPLKAGNHPATGRFRFNLTFRKAR